MLLFISAILTFVWRTGSVLDPPDTGFSCGPWCTDHDNRCICAGPGVSWMIVRTLRNYGSYQNSSRTFPSLGTGMGVRNEFGKAVNELKASSAKRPRARDIDATLQPPRRNQHPQKNFLPLFWTLPHHGSRLSPLRQGKVNI
jgi:hypothetical protein